MVMGNGNVLILACTAPTVMFPIATDCDDALAFVHPNAEETCNFIDDNCNNAVDETLNPDLQLLSIIKTEPALRFPAMLPHTLTRVNGADGSSACSTGLMQTASLNTTSFSMPAGH
jgi:hypothetical protein